MYFVQVLQLSGKISGVSAVQGTEWSPDPGEQHSYANHNERLTGPVHTVMYHSVPD